MNPWSIVDVLLSVMMSLTAPGESPYSAIAVDPGAVCDTAYSLGCRAETEAEALERWRVIAQATAEVSLADPELMARVLTVVFHESGFRRDVHAGVGEFARGDRGQSWGLGQRLLGRGTTRRGWFGHELVGVDIESTRRALATVGDNLIRCEGSFACYGGVKDGRRSKAIAARVRTYERIRAALDKALGSE